MKDMIVFFAVVLGGLLLWLASRRKGQPRFRKRPMLTGSDVEFFHLLRRILPDYTICPRVALSALVEPGGIGLLRQAAYADLAGRQVGFAIFDEDLKLLAVIELDHRSRPGRSAVRQDAYLASAGIPCLRFRAKRPPSETKLLGMLFPRSGSVQCRPAHFVLPEPAMQAIEYRRPQMPWRNTEKAHI